MKIHIKPKNSIIFGSILIILAILIGLIFENDIGFLLAGFGTVIIGISILAIINKGNN